MLACAGHHGYLLCLFDGLLIYAGGVVIVHGLAARHFIGDLAGLGVEHLTLIGIGSVRTGDIWRKAGLDHGVEHCVKLRHMVRPEKHVAGDADFRDLRLICGGKEVVVIHYRVYVQRDVDIRPDVFRRHGRLLRGVRVGEGDAVRADIRPIDAAEDNVRLPVHAGDDNRI